MSEISRLWATIGADFSGLQSGLGSVRSMLHSAAMDMQMTGMSLSMGLTLPLVALGKIAIDAATTFDTQMRNIQSISRQTDAEIAAMGKQFISMSTDLEMTRDSAAELAEGFYFIQSSGFAGADGITVLEVATKAASAGLSDTATASKAILATLNAYSLTAKDAAHVSDVLFKTVDLGVLTFDDLAAQLGDVVNTSATVGVSIEEVGAAIAQMTRKGVSSAESVTALNQLMLQFISPSEKMKKTAEAMGIELSVASLRSKGLAGALQEILEKGGGPDAFLALFGDNVRALKGALSIAGDGMGDFTAMMEEFGNVTGRTEEAFATQTKSFAAQFDNLKNRGEAAKIALGETLVPVLLELLNGLMPIIDALKTINPEWLKWLIIIGGVLAGIGPFLMLLSTLATALSFLLGPLGLVIIALGILGAAWATNFGGIRDITDSVIGSVRSLIDMMITGDFSGGIFGLSEDSPVIAGLLGIRDAAIGFFDAFMASAPQVIAAAQLIWDTLVSSLQQAWPQIEANLGIVIEGIKTGINMLAQFWKDHGMEVIAVLTFMGQMAVAILVGLMTLITGIVAVGVQIMQGDWVGALNTMGATLESFFNTILAVVGTNMESFRATWAGVWDLIVIIWIQSIFNIQDRFSAWLMNMTSGIQAWIINTVNAVRNMGPSWAGVWDLLVIIVTQTWTNMKNAVAAKMMEMTSGIQTWIINTINSIRGKYSEFMTLGSQLFEGLKSGILQKVTEIQDAVVRSIIDVINAARNALGISSPSQVFAAVGQNLMAGMALGITGGASMAARALSDVSGGLTLGVSGAIAPAFAGAGAGGGGMNWTGDLIVNGTNDPQETARLVIRELQDRDLLPRRRA